VAADLTDPERVGIWESWREQPLDLRDAPVADLALLPGSDHATAEAVVVLREAGELQTWEDLRRIDGLDPHRLEEWRDLATLGRLRGWRIDGRWDGADARSAGRLREGRTTLGWVTRSDPGVRRGWVRVEGRRWSVVAGALRARFGGGLVEGDALARGRSGWARAPRAGRIRGRTDGSIPRAWSGAALTFDLGAGRGRVLHGRDPEDRRTTILAWSHAAGAGGAWGTVLAAGERPARMSLWMHRELPQAGSIWFDVGLSPRLRAGATAAGWSMRGRGWRLQTAVAHSDRSQPAARDPLTGLPFDRPHTAWQAHGRVRVARVTFEGSVIRRLRSAGAARTADQRVRLGARWTLPRARSGDPRWSVRLGLGVDEDLDAPIGEPRARLVVERSTEASRVRAAWGRRGPVADAVEAWSLRYRRRTPSRLLRRVELGAGVNPAARSAAWAVVRPLAGPLPLWIPGHGHAAWIAGEVHWLGTRIAAWAWHRGPDADGATGWGVALHRRGGSMVRRLQRRSSIPLPRARAPRGRP
jgi:hypothetical protein